MAQSSQRRGSSADARLASGQARARARQHSWALRPRPSFGQPTSARHCSLASRRIAVQRSVRPA